MIRMMFRKVLTWLHHLWGGAPFEVRHDRDRPPMDIDEFARLLKSGTHEDLELIARTLSRPDKIKI